MSVGDATSHQALPIANRCPGFALSVAVASQMCRERETCGRTQANRRWGKDFPIYQRQNGHRNLMSDFLHVPVLISIEKPMFSIEAEILFAINIPELQIHVYTLLIRGEIR